MLCDVKYAELWEPWELTPAEPRTLVHGMTGKRIKIRPIEVPDDLAARFEAARTEMQAVWMELRDIEAVWRGDQ